MPAPDQFMSTEGYCSTLAHEAAHWMSHPTRLNRELGKRFGDKAYGLEELIAETSAALTCIAAGIIVEPRAETAKYLNHWVEAIRENKKIIITVFNKRRQRPISFSNPATTQCRNPRGRKGRGDGPTKKNHQEAGRQRSASTSNFRHDIHHRCEAGYRSPVREGTNGKAPPLNSLRATPAIR
jgi:hypothetical protein